MDSEKIGSTAGKWKEEVTPFDAYESTTLELPCRICDARTSHTVLKGYGERVQGTNGTYVGDYFEDYGQICKCTQCGAATYRLVQNSSTFLEQNENDPYPEAENEKLWPPRVITEDLCGGVKDLPEIENVLYRNAVTMLEAGNFTLTALSLHALLERIWGKAGSFDIPLLDNFPEWVNKGWLTEDQARFVCNFITHHRDTERAYTLNEKLLLVPALEGIEILLQKAYLGIDKPITSADKATRREMEKLGIAL
jgi:hypothetical protein